MNYMYGVSDVNCSPLTETGPEVIKNFLCSAQLNMKIFLLMNVKMPTMFAF